MKTILIVDDEAVARRLMYHALKSHFRVLEAEGTVSALAALGTRPVDLVIVDMHLHLASVAGLPDDGMRLQQAIHDRQPLLPVIVVTADPDEELAREMRRRGVSAYLVKPVEPEVLVRAVQRALARKAEERPRRPDAPRGSKAAPPPGTDPVA